MTKNKINTFQTFVICYFIGSSLFQGIAELFLYEQARQNSILAILLSLLIGFIPLILIFYIINYEPNKDIIEKINSLFGKFGHLINFLLMLLISTILTITLWQILNFAEIKYLTGTPPFFVGILFLIPVIYASSKGIETIARSSEILFFLATLFFITISLSLLSFADLENLLPFMEKGIKPVFKGAITFLPYTISPLILLTIIPKNNIIHNESLFKKITFGYLAAFISLAFVSFIIISTLGIELANIYRFPSYIVIKKIRIPGFLENTENILSLHWIFNMYINLCMCFYYMTIYFKKEFKIKKYNILFIILIAYLILKIRDYFLFSSVVTIVLIKKYFINFVSIPIFIIILLISIKIKVGKKQ